MFGCRLSLHHYLPRPSRRSRTYACIAVSKGHVTRDITRWPEIGQEFSPFLLKMAPFGVLFGCPCTLCFLPVLKERGIHKGVLMTFPAISSPKYHRVNMQTCYI